MFHKEVLNDFQSIQRKAGGSLAVQHSKRKPQLPTDIYNMYSIYMRNHQEAHFFTP